MASLVFQSPALAVKPAPGTPGTCRGYLPLRLGIRDSAPHGQGYHWSRRAFRSRRESADLLRFRLAAPSLRLATSFVLDLRLPLLDKLAQFHALLVGQVHPQ